LGSPGAALGSMLFGGGNGMIPCSKDPGPFFEYRKAPPSRYRAAGIQNVRKTEMLCQSFRQCAPCPHARRSPSTAIDDGRCHWPPAPTDAAQSAHQVFEFRKTGADHRTVIDDDSFARPPCPITRKTHRDAVIPYAWRSYRRREFHPAPCPLDDHARLSVSETLAPQGPQNRR